MVRIIFLWCRSEPHTYHIIIFTINMRKENLVKYQRQTIALVLIIYWGGIVTLSIPQSLTLSPTSSFTQLLTYSFTGTLLTRPCIISVIIPIIEFIWDELFLMTKWARNPTRFPYSLGTSCYEVNSIDKIVCNIYSTTSGLLSETPFWD